MRRRKAICSRVHFTQYNNNLQFRVPLFRHGALACSIVSQQPPPCLLSPRSTQQPTAAQNSRSQVCIVVASQLERSNTHRSCYSNRQCLEADGKLEGLDRGTVILRAMVDTESLQTASLYINNQLLSRGLLRDGQSIDFVNTRASDEEGALIAGRIISIVNDLILRRDVRSPPQERQLDYSR